MTISIAQVCAMHGVHPSGPNNTYTERDFNVALDMAVALRGGRLAEKVLAAMEQVEVDEFAHLFPPTGGQVDEPDEFTHLFPPIQ